MLHQLLITTIKNNMHFEDDWLDDEPADSKPLLDTMSFKKVMDKKVQSQKVERRGKPERSTFNTAGGASFDS